MKGGGPRSVRRGQTLRHDNLLAAATAPEVHGQADDPGFAIPLDAGVKPPLAADRGVPEADSLPGSELGHEGAQTGAAQPVEVVPDLALGHGVSHEEAAVVPHPGEMLAAAPGGAHTDPGAKVFGRASSRQTGVPLGTGGGVSATKSPHLASRSLSEWDDAHLVAVSRGGGCEADTELAIGRSSRPV